MKKPIYKRWWFWVIIGVVIVAIIGSSSEDTNDVPIDNSGTISINDGSPNQGNSQNSKTYQQVDLQTMLDELEENALRAETKYQNAYVEITGKIAIIDSDGSYITIEPLTADEWNFDTVRCYIKNDTQRNFIIEKSVGDTVTIKGKVFSIGEVLGYSLNIDFIS